MERKALMMSCGLALFAMYLVYQYLEKEKQSLYEQYGIFSPMVVAAEDILQFQTIKPSDLSVIKVPAALVPPGRIKDPTFVINSVASIPIMKGEQILDNKILNKSIYTGIDGQITAGNRAISVPVNQKSAVGYLLEPGMRIDLAAHFEYKAKGVNISEVKVFLQDVLVLASGKSIQVQSPKGVDQDIVKRVVSSDKEDPERINLVRSTLDYVKKDSNYQTLTVEVTPEQSQQILYALTVYGDSLSVVVRNPNDRRINSNQTTNLREIMGNDSYYVRSRKGPVPTAIPRVKFFDVIGGQRVPVYE